MYEKLVYLDEKVKNIEGKVSKKQNFPFIRFEESICKKIADILSSISQKEKGKDFKKITEQALSDVSSKLVESQV